MRIRKMRASFGKLHETLELTGGMNLLTLPNEAGKSTWSAFLVTMLYGVDTAERASAANQGLPVKERYRPWDGSAMEGAIELTHNGKNITIERTTQRRIPMGAFRAYETESGIPVPELTGENCGKVLCGVERSVFERTAFIRQLGLPVSGDAALEKRLGALVSTGEEGAKSYSELEAALKKQKNALSGRSGKIALLTARSEEIQNSIRELRSMQTDAMYLSGKKESAELEVSRLQALQTRIEHAKLAKRRAALLQLERKTSEQEQLCRSLAETASRLPGEPALRSLQKQMGQAENELQTARMETAFGPDEAEEPQAPPCFSGLNASQAAAQAKADCEEYQRLSSAVAPKLLVPFALFCVVLLIGAALCGFALAAQSSPFLLLCSSAVALAGLAGMVVVLLLRRKKRAAVSALQEQAQAIMQRYGCASCTEILRLAESYTADQEAYTQKILAQKAERRRLAETLDACQRRLQELLSEVRRFAPDACDTPSCRDAVSSALHVYERLSSEQRSLEGLRGQCVSMCQILGEETFAEDPDALELDEAKLLYELRAAQKQFSEASNQLAVRQGAIAAKGDRITLEAKLGELTGELERAKEQAEIIDLAAEALQQADALLRSRFSPQITAEAGRLLGELTGEKYTSLLLEPDMRLSVRGQQDVLMRSAACMSCGTADQMYLALRIAMARRLLPEDVPLILDDALVNFDDTRAAAALRLLRQEANTRQVLLFTCRKLEHGF